MGECRNCIQTRITLGEGFTKGLFTKGGKGKANHRDNAITGLVIPELSPVPRPRKRGTHDVSGSKNPKAEVCVERTLEECDSDCEYKPV